MSARNCKIFGFLSSSTASKYMHVFTCLASIIHIILSFDQVEIGQIYLIIFILNIHSYYPKLLMPTFYLQHDFGYHGLIHMTKKLIWIKYIYVPPASSGRRRQGPTSRSWPVGHPLANRYKSPTVKQRSKVPNNSQFQK